MKFEKKKSNKICFCKTKNSYYFEFFRIFVNKIIKIIKIHTIFFNNFRSFNRLHHSIKSFQIFVNKKNYCFRFFFVNVINVE